MTSALGLAPISVVVPTTRPGLLADHLLGDLAACSPPPVEVIVVLDGVAPVPALEGRALEAVGSRLIVLEREHAGPAAARNAGASVASQSLILLLDDDVRVEPGLVSQAALALAEPGVVAITGTFSDDCGPTDFWSRYKNDYMVFICSLASSETRAILTAIAGVRRETLLEVGGLDSAISEATVEDIDLGLRLSERGLVRFLPSLRVTHLKRYTPRVLIASHFRRSRDMARLLLDRLTGAAGLLRDGGDALNLPLGFVAGVPLAGLWLASPLLYWVSARAALAVALAIPLLSSLTNAGFIAFVGARRGMVRGLASGAMLWFELTLSALAVAWASVSYPMYRVVFRGGADA